MGRTAQGTLGKGGVWVGRVRVLAGAEKRFSTENTESQRDESGWVARGVDALERRGRRRGRGEEDGDSSLYSSLGSSLSCSAFDRVRVAMCVRRFLTGAFRLEAQAALFVESDGAAGELLAEGFVDDGADGGGEIERAFFGGHGEAEEAVWVLVEQGVGQAGGFFAEDEGVAWLELGVEAVAGGAGCKEPEGARAGGGFAVF